MALTMSSLTISLLIVIALFNGFFLFYSQQMDDNNLELDDKYGNISIGLLESQEEIDNLSRSLEEQIDEVREAEETYLAAINGFKALGAALILPIQLTSISVGTTTELLTTDGLIPESYQSLFLVGIVVVILLLAISVLKGDPKL